VRAAEKLVILIRYISTVLKITSVNKDKGRRDIGEVIASVCLKG
jgi:hypothetical protein